MRNRLSCCSQREVNRLIYGYVRVSSIGQARDGNSLEAQHKALADRGCSEIYSEAYTGITTDRPELAKIIAKYKKAIR